MGFAVILEVKQSEGLIGRDFLWLGVGWVEDKEQSFVKILLSCSCQTNKIKGAIYKTLRSLLLKGNCLFFFSFYKQEAHFLLSFYAQGSNLEAA